MPKNKSETPGRTNLDRRIFARIDEIRAAALRWRNELNDADKEKDSAEAISVQIRRMPQIDAIIQRNFKEIRLLCQSADSHSPRGDEWVSSSLTTMELIWENVNSVWPPDIDQPAEGLATMRSCAQQLDEMVYICASMRLTPEINDVLANMEIGQQLDPEFRFGKEFPINLALRRQLILEVAQERNVLNSAAVDADRGVVYRLADPGWPRIRSCAKPVLWWLGALGIVAALQFGARWIPGWPLPPATPIPLVTGYILWTLGAAFHGLIEALRQKRSSTTPAFAAMDSWREWFQIQQRKISTGIVWISLGYLILIYLNLKLDSMTMFLAGYSADSLTELFVQRFEAVSAKVVKSVGDAASGAQAAAKPEGAPAGA